VSPLQSRTAPERRIEESGRSQKRGGPKCEEEYRPGCRRGSWPRRPWLQCILSARFCPLASLPVQPQRLTEVADVAVVEAAAGAVAAEVAAISTSSAVALGIAATGPTSVRTAGVGAAVASTAACGATVASPCRPGEDARITRSLAWLYGWRSRRGRGAASSPDGAEGSLALGGRPGLGVELQHLFQRTGTSRVAAYRDRSWLVVGRMSQGRRRRGEPPRAVASRADGGGRLVSC